MNEPMHDAVLECRALERRFHEGGLDVRVLSSVDLRIGQGETIAVTGASGSGKSTLLHLLAGLDTPSSGEVFVLGQSMSSLGEAARGRLRNRAMGFVYQFHHLLPEFSALENVAMPLLIRGDDVDTARRAAGEMLERVGLSPRAEHKPGELSGGERQRAAIARALVGAPSVVMADEPTGNLDRANAAKVCDLLLALNRDLGTSLLVVTHDGAVATRMRRRFTIVDGQLREDPHEG